DQQSRASEQRYSERDLNANKRKLYSISSGNAGAGTAGQIASGSANCRQKPAHKGGENRAHKRVEDEPPIERDLLDTRKVFGQRAKNSGSRPSEQQSQPCTGKRENEDLRKKMSYDRRAGGTQRKSDRNFLLTGSGSGQQQRGNVDAGDQQQQRNGAEQN